MAFARHAVFPFLPCAIRTQNKCDDQTSGHGRETGPGKLLFDDRKVTKAKWGKIPAAALRHVCKGKKSELLKIGDKKLFWFEAPHLLERCYVARSPRCRQDDEEERGGHQAIEEEDEEDEHVVGLEVVRVLQQALAKPVKRSDSDLRTLNKSENVGVFVSCKVS